jgi:ubiquinone/menaquinone biosynthesis C-methylase UbiE
MAGQFGHPRGFTGSLAGHLMAFKNQPMNRLAVELLAVKPDDHVLEIGFGPGRAVQLLCQTASPASIAGVDTSDVMVRQASRRNRRYIADRQAQLHCASVSELPFSDGVFTKAFAVNSFHHWDDQRQGLVEVRRVLRPDGTLLLCLRMDFPKPWWDSAPGLSDEQVGQVQQLLHEVAYNDVTKIERIVGRRVTCLIGTKARNPE